MANAEITIKQVLISTLKNGDRNARIHNKKQILQLAKSIKTFGFTNPVLIDSNNSIIAGHGRVLAAKELELEYVPAIEISHLSKPQIQAYMIADNKLAENASWDNQLLSQHFIELSNIELDFDIGVIGFEMGEIDFIVGEQVKLDEEKQQSDELDSQELSDDDEADDLISGKTVTQQGDLWILDNHRIFCGDSLKDDSYLKLMDNKEASVIFTDPPYNVKIDKHVCGLGKTKHTEFAMASGEMSINQFTQFLKDIFINICKYSKNGSIHYICMDWRHMGEILSAGNEVYSELKNMCVWVKDNGGMGSLYRSKHELVFVFKNGTDPHINNVQLGKHGRYRTNVWEYAGVNSFARDTSEGDLLAMHPTVKPVDLVYDAIMDCSNRNDIVLDVFLGSGSSLIAAEKTGRICYGLEFEPKYVDTAIRRWQRLTGKKAILAESGMSFDEVEQSKEEPANV